MTLGSTVAHICRLPVLFNCCSVESTPSTPRNGLSSQLLCYSKLDLLSVELLPFRCLHYRPCNRWHWFCWNFLGCDSYCHTNNTDCEEGWEFSRLCLELLRLLAHYLEVCFVVRPTLSLMLTNCTVLSQRMSLGDGISPPLELQYPLS